MTDKIDAIRTCVGCRQRDKRVAMLRVVCVNGQVVIDWQRNTAGRGSHVHNRAECLKQALTRQAFARALRVSPGVDTTPIREQVEKIMDH